MLHMGILAHHAEWQPFLRGLRWIVLDELHVYRGIFGAHVHHILARLQRLCSAAGARPRFIAASATVGNPAAFARTLVGRPFEVVAESGAPRSRRDVLFVNPVAVSPYTAAVHVVAEAIRAGRRTIAFTKARRVTELLHTWLVRQEPEFADRVAPYRAGYLPEERRRLESRLFRGELSAVLSTSALELGIDVGGLDVCVLVGYPGSLISSWQRIGRVGRDSREGTVVLIAMPDALDQYIVRHPELFFGRAFEKAVLDPANPLIAGRHLVCAAAEKPLTTDELMTEHPRGLELADGLTREGRLAMDERGERYLSFRRRPHRDVHPRSAGQPFAILDAGSGKPLGSIDGARVYHECHPGAIYLHGGRTYLVRELDPERRRVRAEPARVDYYTVVLGDKETEILERLDSRRLGPFPVGLGRLKVTVRIREYQKKRLFDGEPLSTHPLTVPPLVFETIGFWIELPDGLPRAYAERDLHFMGGIHATEHATIGLFPLLAIADRGDVGGISYTGHPQTGCPAIFVYDGIPGGAGLAEQGFSDLEGLLRRTLEHVAACACDEGCPACIQSPKCGNGNKPLDKEASLLTLRLLAGESELDALGVEAPRPRTEDELPAYVRPERDERPRKPGISRADNIDPRPEPPRAERPMERPATGPAPSPSSTGVRTLVFDLETQRGADEVGGWANVAGMGLALAVVYDVGRDRFRTYLEPDVDRLLLDLVMADRVVGFNIERFDLPVLSAYTDWDLGRVRTLDLLAEIHRVLGFRVSLAHLAEINLGEEKSGDGLQSLRWWREGRVDLIERYCRKDVDITRRLYEVGRRRGFLLYRRDEQIVRVPVQW
jgi:DEAD/DEAH box helicase domain-containing protein